jgi:hypothetical protein
MGDRCCTPLLYGHQKGHVRRWDMASELVGDTGIEPVTSSVSTNGPQVADQGLCDDLHQRRRRSVQLSTVGRIWAPLGAGGCSQLAPTVGAGHRTLSAAEDCGQTKRCSRSLPLVPETTHKASRFAASRACSRTVGSDDGRAVRDLTRRLLRCRQQCRDQNGEPDG